MLVEKVIRFLQPAFTLNSVFMAVGGADSRLALHAAGFVERVYAVDTVLAARRRPPNLVQVASNPCGIPLPEGSVHLAYGDAMARLKEIHRVLARGGAYHCSGGVPELFREAGFSRVRFYVGALRVPFAVAKHFDYRSAAFK